MSHALSRWTAAALARSHARAQFALIPGARPTRKATSPTRQAACPARRSTARCPSRRRTVGQGGPRGELRRQRGTISHGPDSIDRGPASRLHGIPPGQEPTLWAVVRALEAAADAIAALGRSGPGDKTMLDALLPAVAALRVSALAGHDLRDALRQAAEAAERGLEATRPLVARRGRASYLGERSAGHLDPGAASSLLLVRALAETIADR